MKGRRIIAKGKNLVNRQNAGPAIDDILEHKGSGIWITRLSNGSIACILPDRRFGMAKTAAAAIANALKQTAPYGGIDGESS